MRTPCPALFSLAIALLVGACAESVPDSGWGFGSAPGGEDDAAQGDAESSSAAGSEGEASEGAEAEATTASDPADDSADPGASSDGGDDEAGGSDPASSDDGTPDGSTEGGGLDTTYDYGRCNEACAADMCITIEGFNGSFCTTECVDGACPGPTEGDAVGQCLLGPDLMMPPVNCVLTCSLAGQNCPGEMACVDAMMGGDAGICLWQ